MCGAWLFTREGGRQASGEPGAQSRGRFPGWRDSRQAAPATAGQGKALSVLRGVCWVSVQS